MKCKYCNNEAVIKKNKKNICKEHFNQFYYNRVKKSIKNTPVKEKKILVAISGGKDSVAILHALNHLKTKYKYELEAIFLNLGIDNFSKESLEASENLCKHLEVPMHIYNLDENYKFSIPDISKITKKICAYCGTVKRYILNKFAWENNFDFIITGHNMDDEIIFLNQNILSGSVEYVKRYCYFFTPTLKDKKLVGKIKPQFFISEQDNINYCKANNIDFVSAICPYSENSTHKVLQEGVEFFNKKMDYSLSFLQFFLKINEYLPEKAVDFKFCKICDYPTTNFEICKFCRIVKELQE